MDDISAAGVLVGRIAVLSIVFIGVRPPCALGIFISDLILVC